MYKTNKSSVFCIRTDNTYGFKSKPFCDGTLLCDLKFEHAKFITTYVVLMESFFKIRFVIPRKS